MPCLLNHSFPAGQFGGLRLCVVLRNGQAHDSDGVFRGAFHAHFGGKLFDALWVFQHRKGHLQIIPLRVQFDKLALERGRFLGLR